MQRLHNKSQRPWNNTISADHRTLQVAKKTSRLEYRNSRLNTTWKLYSNSNKYRTAHSLYISTNLFKIAFGNINLRLSDLHYFYALTNECRARYISKSKYQSELTTDPDR